MAVQLKKNKQKRLPEICAEPSFSSFKTFPPKTLLKLF